MTPRVDIEREAAAKVISDLSALAIMWGGSDIIEAAQLQIEALRDALDAAERERDEARENVCKMRETGLRVCDAASAEGYARGVRDAAAIASKPIQALTYGGCRTAYEMTAAAILALLPADAAATKKETDDAE